MTVQTPLDSWISLLSSLDLRLFPLHGIDHSSFCTCHRGGECDRPGKHPLHKNWQVNAQPFPAPGTIPEWANIGIATGGTLVILDIDDPDQVKPDDFPPTFTVSTGKGFHLYYRTPGTKLFRSLVRWRAGVDVRGEGGLVVAPPSLHVSGIRYLPLDTSTPIAPISNELHALLPPFQAKPVISLPDDWEPAEADQPNSAVTAEWMLEEMRDAPAGERNATLFKTALRIAHLVEIGWLRPGWLDELSDAAGEAGLSGSEITRTISSAAGGCLTSVRSSARVPQHRSTPKDDG